MKKQDIGLYIGLFLTGAILVGILPIVHEWGKTILFDRKYSVLFNSIYLETGWIFIAFFILIAICFGFFSTLAFSRINFTSQENRKVDYLKQERIAIQEKIRDKASSNIIDIIQLNLNQLDEYYTINKNQARNSFYTSLFLIFLGFLIITFAIVLFLSNPSLNISITIISGISGVLLQFIGGANFFIYSKTLEQVNRFYNNLIKTQDTMLAIELCRQIDDEEKKRNLMEKIVVDLLKRSSLYATELIKSPSIGEGKSFQQEIKPDEELKTMNEKNNDMSIYSGS